MSELGQDLYARRLRSCFEGAFGGGTTNGGAPPRFQTLAAAVAGHRLHNRPNTYVDECCRDHGHRQQHRSGRQAAPARRSGRHGWTTDTNCMHRHSTHSTTEVMMQMVNRARSVQSTARNGKEDEPEFSGSQTEDQPDVPDREEVHRSEHPASERRSWSTHGAVEDSTLAPGFRQVCIDRAHRSRM